MQLSPFYRNSRSGAIVHADRILQEAFREIPHTRFVIPKTRESQKFFSENDGQEENDEEGGNFRSFSYSSTQVIENGNVKKQETRSSFRNKKQKFETHTQILGDKKRTTTIDKDGDSNEKKTVESDLTEEETAEFQNAFESNENNENTGMDIDNDTKNSMSDGFPVFSVIQPSRTFFGDDDFFESHRRRLFQDDFFGIPRRSFLRNQVYRSSSLEHENKQLRERISKLENELKLKNTAENTEKLNQTEKK